MFGFPLLRALNILPIEELTADVLMDNYFGNKSVDLSEAKLLDTHAYVVNGVQYEQKVYRLKDNSIYVETDQNTDASIKLLEQELKNAVIKQEYEKAADIRDKINLLKKNQTPL